MAAKASPRRRTSPRIYPVRPMLPRDFVESHRRERFAMALSEVVHEGEVELTVAQVVRRARSSRNTFYESFRSKEACFDFACAWARERLAVAIGTAGQTGGEGEERTLAVIGALLEVAIELPAPVELCLAHSSADPEARQGLGDAATIEALARALAPGHDGGETDLRPQLLAAGIVAVLAVRLHREELSALTELEEELVGFARLQLVSG